MVEQRETRLLAEYLAEHWPNARVQMRVPLGPVDPDLLAAFGARAVAWERPFRQECDAVIWAGGRLVLVEAKILSAIDGIAKLPIYRGLVDVTPELLPYRGLLRDMLLVCPWNSPQVDAMAATVGVRVAIYRPAWIEPYLESRLQYWTREYRLNRHAKQALRRELGVD